MQTGLQAQGNVARNNWKMRDFITLAIFNVVMLIVITVNGMFAYPINYLIGAGVIALINGPIYMVMASKINKRGVLFFSALLTGLFFVAFGQVYYLLVFAITGLLCELIIRGGAGYRQPVRNAVAYSLFYVGYMMCGVVPLIFFRKQYVAGLEKSYSPEALADMLYYYETPYMVLIMCAITIAGAVGGCLLGHALLRKHVKKARLV
ncbi:MULTISPECIES: MptD family putative ECF transporter S component [unclassified Paenibacillus]|uniref:MptD family putative ECF transporter S component n=1 Tax=unclassified Paenibacillus TaxID=185978 RepID=UPI0030FB2C77